MNTMNAKEDTRMERPGDNRFGQDGAAPEWTQWIQRWTLLSIILDKVETIRWPESDYRLAARSQYSFRPAVMLAILTYCYSTGTYRSREMEAEASRDEALRCLCAGRVPPWQEIRKFRCSHRLLLKRALAATWRLARRYPLETKVLRSDRRPGGAALTLRPRAFRIGTSRQAAAAPAVQYP